MIVDTHSHLQFNAFKEDLDDVIKRTVAENIWTINVGTQLETSRQAVELAEKYGNEFFAAVGLHPMYTGSEFIKLKADKNEGGLIIENNFDKERYGELANSKKVVAIGEIGLDYYYKPKTTAKLAQFKAKQKEVFLAQLDLAKELNLPVILHCRMAHDDVIEILKSQKVSGVIHCFTGTLEQARKYVEMGLYLGINGVIFKFNIDKVIKNISLDNLVVETDCPYLTPPQEAGKRNEPMFIKHTMQKIADFKNISFQEVCDKTTENARKLFNI